MLRSFSEIVESAKNNAPKKISLVNGDDPSSLTALYEAQKSGIAKAVLVGEPDKISKAASEAGVNIDGMEIVEAYGDEVPEKAVSLVSRGEADVLMKGNVKTSVFMKAVLNKEWGLRSGELLSHAFIYQCSIGKKLRIITDGGININPDLNGKVEILKNAVKFSRAMGVEKPLVAVLAAVESVNPKMQETLDAQKLSEMSKEGLFGECTVEGPLAFDLAVSEKSAATKGIKGEVPGKADILLVPDICSGNVLGKSLIYYGNVPNGGMVVGSSAPVVFLSRADNEDTKLNSIALGTQVKL